MELKNLVEEMLGGFAPVITDSSTRSTTNGLQYSSSTSATGARSIASRNAGSISLRTVVAFALL